jgi:hypothetical protein
MSQEPLTHEQQLGELEVKLKKNPSTDLCVKILRLVHEAQLRRPDVVIECGKKILFDSKPSLGDQGTQLGFLFTQN